MGGKAFVQHFYNAFDSNVDSLAGLYQPSSMLTFEGNQVLGSQAIIQKLKSFGAVKHTVQTLDVQPSSNPNSIYLHITGMIQIGGDNPLHFTEFFSLVSTGPGAYYVHNVIFRLVYGM